MVIEFRKITDSEPKYMSENGIEVTLNIQSKTIQINSIKKPGTNALMIDDGTYTIIDFWQPSSVDVINFSIGFGNDDDEFPGLYIHFYFKNGSKNGSRYTLVKSNQGGKNKKTEWKKTGKFVYIRIKSRTSGELKVTKMPTYANLSKPGQVRVQKKKADGTKYFASFNEVKSN